MTGPSLVDRNVVAGYLPGIAIVRDGALEVGAGGLRLSKGVRRAGGRPAPTYRGRCA